MSRTKNHPPSDPLPKPTPDGERIALSQRERDGLVQEMLDLELRLEMLSKQKDEWLTAWRNDLAKVAKRRHEVVSELRGDKPHQIDIFKDYQPNGEAFPITEVDE